VVDLRTRYRSKRRRFNSNTSVTGGATTVAATTTSAPFEEFPTYDGFVVHDPEGRWVEIMEYTNDTFRVQEFTNVPSGECGLQMVGNTEICSDVNAMKDWYVEVMGMHVLEEFRSNGDHTVVMSDSDYDADARRTLFVLENARHEHEKQHLAEHGPYISAIMYQAKDVARAWEDALWAGMKELHAPEKDSMTGLLTARLAEPCGGNVITLTEQYAP
jgi:4-hydroxyphenylpyruvate dioxygenase-like putative hemolysin